MTTLVFGAGFLGKRLASTLPQARLSTVDITDAKAVFEELRTHSATAVINAAGKTGHPNVDWCETHPVETWRSNVIGALNIAEACAKADAYMLHLASGCIFYGPSPSPDGWREEDFANPTSLYSRSKYAADLMLSKMPNVSVVRLRMPVDGSPGPRNLITKLASYTSIIDVENSVTVVDDLVHVVQTLVDRKLSGVFHATNPGVMRHRELLELYKEYVNPLHSFELISEDALVARGLAVKARSNCVLSSRRLAEVGIVMRPIGEALRDAVQRYARHARLAGPSKG